MNHGSLFSGIGGFDLAAEWMGWSNTFHCEWNPFGRKVLNHYWPKSISYEDITKTDFTIHRGQIDILTGGFPCQPYSTAGKRKGKEDERHLWPEMLRAIREIKPNWVVGENVRGLINWSDGLVFDEVQADLEANGYEVQPFLLPACGVNAPHRRDRVWFVAHSSSKRCNDRSDNREERHVQDNINRDAEKGESERGGWFSRFSEARQVGDAANTNSKRSQGRSEINKWKEYNSKGTEKGIGFRANSKNNLWKSRSNFQNFPTQPPICGGNDGLPTELDGITFPKWRNESIKAYGNAIVPQVALQVFKSIQDYETRTRNI